MALTAAWTRVVLLGGRRRTDPTILRWLSWVTSGRIRCGHSHVVRRVTYDLLAERATHAHSSAISVLAPACWHNSGTLSHTSCTARAGAIRSQPAAKREELLCDQPVGAFQRPARSKLASKSRSTRCAQRDGGPGLGTGLLHDEQPQRLGHDAGVSAMLRFWRRQLLVVARGWHADRKPVGATSETPKWHLVARV